MGYAVRTKNGTTRVVMVDDDGRYKSDRKRCNNEIYDTKSEAQDAKESGFGSSWRMSPRSGRRSLSRSRSMSRSSRGRRLRSRKVKDPMRNFEGDGPIKYVPVRDSDGNWVAYEVFQIRDHTNNKYAQFIKIPDEDETRVKRLPDDVDPKDPFFFLYPTAAEALNLGVDERLARQALGAPALNLSELEDATDATRNTLSLRTRKNNNKITDYLESSSADFWGGGSFLGDTDYSRTSLMSKAYPDKWEQLSRPYKKSWKGYRPPDDIISEMNKIGGMPMGTPFSGGGSGNWLTTDSLRSYGRRRY